MLKLKNCENNLSRIKFINTTNIRIRQQELQMIEGKGYNKIKKHNRRDWKKIYIYTLIHTHMTRQIYKKNQIELLKLKTNKQTKKWFLKLIDELEWRSEPEYSYKDITPKTVSELMR